LYIILPFSPQYLQRALPLLISGTEAEELYLEMEYNHPYLA